METRTPQGTQSNGNNPMDELTSQVSGEIAELRERLDDMTERAAEFIRTRPGTSLLIAAAAGYLIGRILRS